MKNLGGLVCLALMFHRAPGSDTEGGGQTEAQQREAFLNKIGERVTQELETRGMKKGDNFDKKVEDIIGEKFKGLDVEQVRNFKFDENAETIKNLATAVEKLEQRGQKSGNPVRDLFDAKKTEIENVFNARVAKASGGGEVSINIPLAALNMRAAQIMTTENVVDLDSNNLPIEILNSAAQVGYVGRRYGVEFIDQIADVTTVGSLPTDRKYWLEEGDIEGAFAIVAEGGLKPLLSATLVGNFAKAKKVAGKYIITEELAKFMANVLNIIDRLLRDKLLRDLRAILLLDLQGQAAGYVGTTLDDTFEAPNDYDAIAAVSAQIESLSFVPDVLILNPQDKWRIRTSKDADGRYLFPVTVENGVTRVYELRVVTSTYQTPGTFTVGESGLFKVEQETVTARLGYGITTQSAQVNGTTVITAVESDVDHNRMRMILETFFVDYIATPNIGSYVTATFANVKAQLLAA